jgi:hypothetical protein
MKTALDNVKATAASLTLSLPLGISRELVRGFLASIDRSTIRLKPIAANRALVKASRTHPISEGAISKR